MMEIMMTAVGKKLSITIIILSDVTPHSLENLLLQLQGKRHNLKAAGSSKKLVASNQIME
jgi:hypothetical protein